MIMKPNARKIGRNERDTESIPLSHFLKRAETEVSTSENENFYGGRDPMEDEKEIVLYGKLITHNYIKKTNFRFRNTEEKNS